MKFDKVVQGDSLKVLREIPDNTFHSMVTDPPGGISWLGKDWDSDRGGRDKFVGWLMRIMRQSLRTLKPGAHGLVWSQPRTSHWTGFALENAGFRIRDQVFHHHAMGTPKCYDVTKALEKEGVANVPPILKTALKPASSVWWLVQKPLEAKLVDTYLDHGTGPLNIGACYTPSGRYPANVVFSHNPYCGASCSPLCAVQELEDQRANISSLFHRFQYQAVPTKKEKDAGLSKFAMKRKAAFNPGGIQAKRDQRSQKAILTKKTKNGGKLLMAPNGKVIRVKGPIPGYAANNHETIKSLDLMSYFVRLVTIEPGQVVLDPFCGSGTTLAAAAFSGYRYFGIELRDQFVKIAEQRAKWWGKQGSQVVEQNEEVDEVGLPRQRGLFE